MQVNETQDDKLETDFNAYLNRKGISTKVNVTSYNIRKSIQRKRDKFGTGKGKKENIVDPTNAHGKKQAKIRHDTSHMNYKTKHATKTPVIGMSLHVDQVPYWPREEGEEVLGVEYSYISTIGVLMYLANSMSPDISFVVNLLARYSVEPTKRH